MSDDKPTSRFFQFPIRAIRLSGGISHVDPLEREEVFDRAIGYAITYIADHTDPDEEAAERMAERFFEANEIEESGCEDQRHFAVACETLGLCRPKLDAGFISQCRTHYASVEEIPGSNLYVRIREDLMREFRQSWDFRDSAILCGVYAGIGKAKYQRLDCNRIRALAMGFASVRELRQYGHGIPELTDRQLRYTLGKLEKRGLFQKVTSDLRNFYYSNRLSKSELIAEIAQLVASKSRHSANVNETRMNIMAKAEELRAAARKLVK